MNGNFSLSCNTLHISQNVFREARRVLLRYLIVFTMPVAPFGFAISDFIAVGDLAVRCVKVIRKNSDAEKSYKSLHEILQSVFNLSREIHSYLSSPSLRSHVYRNPSTFMAIHHEFEGCQKVLEEFLVSTPDTHIFVILES